MPTFNSGLNYNDQFNAFYNSSPRVALVLEYSTSTELLTPSAALSALDVASITAVIVPSSSFSALDIGSADDTAQMTASPVVDDGVAWADQLQSIVVMLNGLDQANSSEAVHLTADLVTLDGGLGSDIPALTAHTVLSDALKVIDLIMASAQLGEIDTAQGSDLAAVAKTLFIIDQNGILQPLGITVLRDSRQDLLPSMRVQSEELPGRHGEQYFGTKLGSRLIELQVAMGVDPSTREQVKRLIAQWLSPEKGYQPLVFADDMEKIYQVRYAGQSNLEQWPEFLEFVIPLRSGPWVDGGFEQTHSGSGTLVNAGDLEAPLVIEIVGPIHNPYVDIGQMRLSYTGALLAGQKLVIDTDKRVVTLDGVNALPCLSGALPKLPPGGSSVTASDQVTFRWRSRWSG